MPNNKFSQISLFDIYEDVNTSFTEKKSELVSLLEKHIDFSSLISYGFRHTFYSTFGRKHKYHLVSFIKALVIQKLFAFSYDSQLILVLKCSDELRNFCGFDRVPDGSYFTRFKQKYCDYITQMFHKLVEITEPICRDIAFFDDDFRKSHPDVVSKKSNNPDLDKEISDSHSLKPVLSDFFKKHPKLSYSTFLGDVAFDSYDNYTMLKNDFSFKRVCIPLNNRNSKNADASFDEHGTPVCPLDKTPFSFLGKSGGENRSLRFKWVCPKSIPCGSTRICTCETPCTASSYGKCTYTYPDKNFRMYPGIPRNTEHWDNLYKHRVYIERTIFLLKGCFGLDSLRTHNTLTVKADVYLAAITQLIGVILAKSLHELKLFKSVRKLIKKVS